MEKRNADILDELYIEAERKLLVRNKEEFAKALGYSRGRLHTKIVNNDIDDSLIEKARVFINGTENVLPETRPDAVKSSDANDSLEHISASHHELAVAHRLQAEILLLETKKGQSLVDTNRELVLLLKSSGVQPKIQPIVPPLEVAYFQLLQAGIVEGKWHSVDEGRSKLDRMIYGNQGEHQQYQDNKGVSDSN